MRFIFCKKCATMTLHRFETTHTDLPPRPRRKPADEDEEPAVTYVQVLSKEICTLCGTVSAEGHYLTTKRGQ